MYDGLILTDADIMCIYQDHVLVNNTPEYLGRYVPLPLEKNTKRWRWEGKAFPRVITVLEFACLVREYDMQPGKLLMLNGGEWGDPELEYVQPAHMVSIDYDEATGANDLHTLALSERDFDLVLVAQTLEHLHNPIAALERIFHHITPGGYLFTSVPVVNIPHATPQHHYTGFTPTGLGAICRVAGFDIAAIGQWGNSRYINLIFNRKCWPDYRQLGSELQNEFENPVDAWILARRPT